MVVDPEEKSAKDLQKVKLEIRKLNRDLKVKPFTDRERFWAETVRLVLIALVTGVVTYFVNTKTEDVRASNSYSIEEYKSFLARKASVFDRSLAFGARQQLACAVTDQYRSSKNNEIINELRDIAEICAKDSMMKSTEAAIQADAPKVRKEVSKAFVQAFSETEKQAKAVEQLLKVNSEDRTLQAQQQHLEARLDSLLLQNSNVRNLSEQAQSVWKNFKDQATIVNQETKKADFVSDRGQAAGYPNSAWFKEDYFLALDDMKVTLDEIENQNSVLITVCQSISKMECAPEDVVKLSSNRLTTNEPIRFVRNGSEYIIRLDRVGSAGRNPFTKAAYVTFQKYML